MDIITVCMGSSCFSRGNSSNAELIQLFIKENNLYYECKSVMHLERSEQ